LQKKRTQGFGIWWLLTSFRATARLAQWPKKQIQRIPGDCERGPREFQ